MLVTLVAVLCSTLAGPPLCREEVVADSTGAGFTLQSCQIQGQIGISDWMSKSQTYRANWRLERYKCVLGPYTPRSNA